MRTLLFIFSLAYTAIGQTNTKCPASYNVVGTGCYRFPENYTSWTVASTFCQFSGGYLANIDSKDEQMALKEYHEAILPDFAIYVSRWIGATDMLSHGTWRWVPSGKTVLYTNWIDGYPTLQPTYNCVYWSTMNNVWYNIDCCTAYDNVYPLCEADPI